MSMFNSGFPSKDVSHVTSLFCKNLNLTSLVLKYTLGPMFADFKTGIILT